MTAREISHYGRLNIPLDATPEEIRRAYRVAARRLHPDTNTESGATELFLKAQEAYELLINQEDRQAYDALIRKDFPIISPLSIDAFYSRAIMPRIHEPQLIYVLLEIYRNPDFKSDARTHLNVSLVVDSSTSMGGLPMDTVKATAIELIHQLKDEDTLSIVAFNDRAAILVPAGNRVERLNAETHLRLLMNSGSTEILKGLEAGFNEIQRHRKSDRVNHIILITDGRTYGDEDSCLALADKASQQGIGISALGIGNKWNDAFLDELTSITGGSCRFVARPADIRLLLKEKFSSLGKSFAEGLSLDFDLPPTVELRYAFRIQPDAAPLGIEAPLSLGTVARGEPMNVLLEILVTEVSDETRNQDLLKSWLSYELPGNSVERLTCRLELSRPTGKEPDPNPPPHSIVQAMSKLTLYRMQERARQDVEAGRVKEATRRLQAIATNLLAQGDRDLAQTVLSEAAHLEKKMSFSEEGEKRIKYGTRALLLPSEISDNDT